MKIDIRHIGKLARLHIDDSDLPRFEKEMEAIIDMVNSMAVPQAQSTQLDPAGAMALREDVVCPSFPRGEILANAPQVEAGCVVVPKTVE